MVISRLHYNQCIYSKKKKNPQETRNTKTLVSRHNLLFEINFYLRKTFSHVLLPYAVRV